MSNVLLCYANRADNATLAAASGAFTIYPLNNLKTSPLAQVARTGSAAMVNTKFRADLGAAYTLRALALAAHNISSAGAWRVRLGNAPFDADFAAPAAVDDRCTTSGSGYLITGASFTGQHSATAGTLYAEFDTPASGTCPIISLDNNTANEQVRLYTSGTDLKFTVTDGGVTQCDITIGTVAAGVTYKAAVAWSANDFAGCLAGGTVGTDASGTLPTPDRMRLKLDQAGNTMGGTLVRAARWATRLTNAQLQSITTSGPDVLGYNSGWVNALQLTFQGDTPSDWGTQYNALAAFDAVSARYAVVEINDTTNAAGYIQMGRLFVGGGFQPSQMNAEQSGFADSRVDLSNVVDALSGTRYGTARRRKRRTDFRLPVLTEAEADQLHEMQALVGTLGEVVYIPDPANLAKSQRYGGLGLLAELSPIDNPFATLRGTGFRWEEKI